MTAKPNIRFNLPPNTKAVRLEFETDGSFTEVVERDNKPPKADEKRWPIYVIIEANSNRPRYVYTNRDNVAQAFERLSTEDFIVVEFDNAFTRTNYQSERWLELYDAERKKIGYGY